MRRIAALGLLLLGLTLPAAPARAQQEQEDPFLWLEEVEGQRALQWVEARNRATIAELEAHPAYQPIYQRTLHILNNRDRIAFPSILGDRLYNFWQDERNPRGVWRRTTWESYLGGSPAWETVIDVDSLAKAESVPWSFAGASCLPPEYRRCLVRLSRGGADAVQVREFDAAERRFVEGGFFLPEGKQSVAWRGPDAVLVATNFGEGTMTESGYARVAKLWRRGTPLSAAVTLFEGQPKDVSVSVGMIRTATRTYHGVWHRPSFFQSSLHLLDGDELIKVDLPMDADPYLVRDQLVVYLRAPWEVGGRTFPAGSLVAAELDDFMEGERDDIELVLQPDARSTIRGVSATRDYLLVSMLNNVRGELRRFRHEGGRWVGEKVPAPELGNVGVAATSPLDNRFFFSYSGFTQPTTLYLGDADGDVREIRRMPEMFDAANLTTEQFEATSKDGTRIPYFVVRRSGAPLDGNAPTLLYAYGGFESPEVPAYSATVGSAWLERGGVYVLANIRGGGEFGPQWHRAGLKENRQRVYDDFIAVAEDLVARRITTPRRLGIMGGSNGGLLVGVAFTQRPELFNAVVAQVPLLDMRRYNRLLAGASWMAEYGNPDVPEEWAYISRYSPYQNLRAGQKYPRVLFYTTTRDDRVHPGHARKMAAKMEAMGYPIYYFENTEGGHGAGVTSEQRARMYAVIYTYLLKQLAD
ncbi:MAG TPA: prolyl oligopeptidase family serine peptidase [Longimicrobium sp.]|nr:prolyl oligopeptidase family serine peptidase [Longimicrobium sp.]